MGFVGAMPLQECIDKTGDTNYMNSLDKLFKPRSIAVLGASTNENKVGSQMLHSLRRFPGPLFPINPKADTLQGLKVYTPV